MNRRKRMSNKVLIIIVFIFSFISCKAQKKLTYSKNRNKSDTIYVYYKGLDKKELKQKFMHDSIRNHYGIWYKFMFNYESDFVGRKKSYFFIWSSHNTSGGRFIKKYPLKRKKSFLKTQKNKIFTYKDLKKQSDEEIEKFYRYNHLKTVFLIDKNENKKDTIFLRKVQFGGTFPVIQ